jgi:hypothetical protein
VALVLVLVVLVAVLVVVFPARDVQPTHSPCASHAVWQPAAVGVEKGGTHALAFR